MRRKGAPPADSSPAPGGMEPPFRPPPRTIRRLSYASKTDCFPLLRELCTPDIIHPPAHLWQGGKAAQSAATEKTEAAVSPAAPVLQAIPLLAFPDQLADVLHQGRHAGGGFQILFHRVAGVEHRGMVPAPKARPMLGRLRPVISRVRYMATCRGTVISRFRRELFKSSGVTP